MTIQWEVALIITQDKYIQGKFTSGKDTKGNILQIVPSITLFCPDCALVVISAFLSKTIL